MTEITIEYAADMSEFWRLITAEGRDADHRIHGTWWVSADHVKPVDVTIWDTRGQYGRMLSIDSLTAFREDGEIRIPEHMIRSNVLAECEDAWELLLAVITAAADATWKPLEGDSDAQ